ncbi:MAG TPA: histidine--tRNA ligase [Bacteroidetes bacterium]|nr:histidine--tRNA ligase [Bacteroidota bacterium]
MAKPSIPKGTRDFSTEEMNRREYIFDTIKSVFRLYGYQPIETPAMENLSTLLGKYGDEGDRLLFKVLNSGDYLSTVSDEDLNGRDSSGLSLKICDKGLRYDLTVPFARYVVQHRNEIVFPFRRYQIQPVWRADRPQKGRYREFFQCDADVVGSDSLLNEYELIKIIDEVFSRLGIRITVKLNNRKILAGIAEYIGQKEKIVDITVAIDKLDKIGMEAVNLELKERGLTDESIEKLQPVLNLQGDSNEKLKLLENLLAGSKDGLKGVEELTALFKLLGKGEVKSGVQLDLTLARGLDYYTGAIIEVKSLDVEIGSISGGGRYDNLTGVFGLQGISGVGVSFGADRIYDVMSQLDLFGNDIGLSTQALVLNFGKNEINYALKIVDSLRKLGIRSELYPDAAKIRKQMSYANSKGIPYIFIAGEEEIANERITVKEMVDGKQKVIGFSELEEWSKKLK